MLTVLTCVQCIDSLQCAQCHFLQCVQMRPFRTNNAREHGGKNDFYYSTRPFRTTRRNASSSDAHSALHVLGHGRRLGIGAGVGVQRRPVSSSSGCPSLSRANCPQMSALSAPPLSDTASVQIFHGPTAQPAFTVEQRPIPLLSDGQMLVKV